MFKAYIQNFIFDILYKFNIRKNVVLRILEVFS
jgi:hypothetical protein